MKKAILVGILASLLCASGCSKSNKTDTAADAEPTVNPAETEPVVEEAPIAKAQVVDVKSDENCQPVYETDVTNEQWVDANNDFAVSMLRVLPVEKSSVFSPYSIERAMGMVLVGACGKTASEIRETLRIPEAGRPGAAGMRVETKMMSAKNDELILDIDNHLWLEKTFTIAQDFMRLMTSDFQAQPTSVSFVNEPEQSRETINKYIAEATHDKIQNILPKGSITALTRLVLTNAVYFKAPWEISFNEKRTNKEDFNTAKGPVQVDMMHLKDNIRVSEGDGYVAFELIFRNSPFAFMVVLPELGEGEDVIAALTKQEARMNAQFIREMREKMHFEKANLAMPKFKLESGASIRGILEQLGTHIAFDKTADFTAMTPDPNGVYVSDVFHNAYIEVDEEGAEAAAATAVVMVTKSARPVERVLDIRVDHPFDFGIVEHQTGTLLFFGRMTTF